MVDKKNIPEEEAAAHRWGAKNGVATGDPAGSCGCGRSMGLLHGRLRVIECTCGRMLVRDQVCM